MNKNNDVNINSNLNVNSNNINWTELPLNVKDNIEKTKLEEYVAKQLSNAAAYLNSNHKFNFTQINNSNDNSNLSESSPEIVSDCSSFFVKENYKYQSYCPFSPNKKESCLTLFWESTDEVVPENRTYKEYKKSCQLRISCSKSIKKNGICNNCLPYKNNINMIYSELYGFSFYLDLEKRSNIKKNIQALEGADEFGRIYKKEPLAIVEAATGSGKTYSACQAAIDIVRREKRVAILAFPTLKLLNQIQDTLIDLIDRKKLTNESEDLLDLDCIDIHIVSMAHDTRYATLNKYFLNGLGLSNPKQRRGTIILTVHSYFKLRGDAPEVSPLQTLILAYCDSIWLVIDEVHNFVQSTTWKIPYESLELIKNDAFGMSRHPVWHHKDIQSKYLYDLEIIRGIISRAQEENGGSVWKLKGPGKYNNMKYFLKFQDGQTVLSKTTYTKRIIKLLDKDEIEQSQNNDITSSYKTTKFAVNYELPDKKDSSNPHDFLNAFKDKILNWKTHLDINDKAKMILPQAETWLSFLLKISYRPCVVFYRPHSYAAGRKLSFQEYLLHHKNNYNSQVNVEKLEVEESTSDSDFDENKQNEKKTTATKDNKKIEYPKASPPFTSEITAMNMWPVFLATRCKTCIFISATIQDYHSKFIEICRGPGDKPLVHVRIKVENRKLDELVFVVTRANWFNIHKKSFWLKIVHVCKSLSDFYTIGFCENQNQAKTFYEWLSNYTSSVGLILEGKEIQGNHRNEPENGDIAYNPVMGSEGGERLAVKVASAMGVMGTGLNLPEQKLVLFNMGLYKPISVFWHCDTNEEAKGLLIQDLISSVQQTLGRNMRMSSAEKEGKCKSRRVTILMGIDHFPGLLPYLELKAKESFKSVNVVSLAALEKNAACMSHKLSTKDKDCELAEPYVSLKQLKSLFEDQNAAEFKDLTWVDLIRLKTISIASKWLQELGDNPFFTLEGLTTALAELDEFCFKERNYLFFIKFKQWLEKETTPREEIKWRMISRKFNLQRESAGTINFCEQLFKVMVRQNQEKDVTFEKILELSESAEYNDFLINENNLLKENDLPAVKTVVDMVPDALNNNIKQQSLHWRTRPPTTITKAIDNFLKEQDLKNAPIIELPIVVFQYSEFFPFEVSPLLKNRAEKCVNVFAKLLSKKGLEFFCSKEKSEVVNLLQQFSRQQVHTKIDSDCLQKHGNSLINFHFLSQTSNSTEYFYAQSALIYYYYYHKNKFVDSQFKIDSKLLLAIEKGQLIEILKTDFEKYNEVDLYNKNLLFVKIAVHYFLTIRAEDDEKLFKGFLSQIIKELDYSKNQFQTLHNKDYQELNKVCVKVTKVLRNSELIQKLQKLNEELLNFFKDKLTSYNFKCLPFKVFPVKVFPEGTFPDFLLETNNVIFDKLINEFSNIIVLGSFMQEFEEYGSFIIPKSHKDLIYKTFKKYCLDYQKKLRNNTKLAKF